MDVREEHIEQVEQGLRLIERHQYEELRPLLTEDVVWAGAITQVGAHEHLRLARGGRMLETEAEHVFELRDGRVSKVTVLTGNRQGAAALLQ